MALRPPHAVVAVAACFGLAAGPVAASAPPPSLLLVTIDTWRWDYIGAAGYDLAKTPALDALAAGGAYYPEALSPTPLTTPAHATLFTGLEPQHHGVLDCTGYSLSASIPTLAEAFRDTGHATAAFVSGDTLLAKYGLGRGFDLYDDRSMARRSGSDWLPASRNGSDTAAACITFLSGLPPERPAFAWLHFFDLHTPHRPRDGWSAIYGADSYAAQASFVDEQIARVLRALRAQGRSFRVVVVGDHGEGLGDHGEEGHGLSPYRETTHVPLILFPRPDVKERRRDPASLADLHATIVQWFALGRPGRTDGRSLLEPEGGDRDQAVFTMLPAFRLAVSPPLGIRRGTLFYLRHAREELYDLESDPAQARDVSGARRHAAALASLRAACDRTFAGVFDAVPSLGASREDLERLEGLGYLGGPVPRRAELQRTPLSEILHDTARLDGLREACFARGACRPLADGYRAFLGKYPRAARVHGSFGKVLLGLGDLAGAAGAFDRAVALDPRDVDSLINLGTLRLQAGRVEEARALLEEAVRLDDTDAVAHKNLGILYGEYLRDTAKAAVHYRRYLALSPSGADAATIEQYLEKIGRTEAPPVP